MTKINPSVEFFINLAKAQAIAARRFDAGLGGLGLSEFVILYYLSQAKGEEMRRIDLADKVGLTASGITRLLAPMEKVGLIRRQTNAMDARVSSVLLAAGGKRRFEEALDNAKYLAEELLPTKSKQTLDTLSRALKTISD